MQEEFGDIRIEKAFHLIREILFCWFKYNIDEENQAQIEDILNRIQILRSDAVINIEREPYLIIITLHNKTIKLTIQSRVKSKAISDPKLKIFEAAVNRAKIRPENKYLSPIIVKLQGNRLIFSISCQNKTSMDKKGQ